MKKIHLIAVVIGFAALYVGISQFMEAAYQKQKQLLETQISKYLPDYCPMAFVTHGDSYINVYCDLKSQQTLRSPEELRLEVKGAIAKWQLVTPTYGHHLLSVYFTSEVRAAAPKK